MASKRRSVIVNNEIPGPKQVKQAESSTPYTKLNLKQHNTQLLTSIGRPSIRSQESALYMSNQTTFIEHKGVKFFESTAALHDGKLNEDDQPSPMTKFPHETLLDELKNWLFDPHSISMSSGAKSTRTKALLQQPEFGDEDLKNTLSLALREIANAHVEIAALVEYAKREPYQLEMENPASEANDAYFDMRPDHFEGVPRWGLEQDVLDAALELDYLRNVIEWLKEQIKEAKAR